jgi:hypothetical protein
VYHDLKVTGLTEQPEVTTALEDEQAAEVAYYELVDSKSLIFTSKSGTLNGLTTTASMPLSMAR